MKVTLDITKLLKEGKITQEEYDKLLHLSSRETGLFAINILMSFGVLAVVGGLITLRIDVFFGFILSFLMVGAGVFINYRYQEKWGILSTVLLLIGSLGLAGSLLRYYDVTTPVFLTITILFIVVGVIAKSGLLISLSVFSLAPIIKMGTFYGHASYFLCVKQPVITIFVYGVLAYTSYFLSTKLSPPYERLALIFSRTSLVMVNLGFWVGSLWGDRMLNFSDVIMAIAWALFLIVACIWGVKKNNRFVVNTSATFGAIHFYTQLFEHLGANPLTTLLAGVITIVVSIVLWKYNKVKMIKNEV